MPTVENSLIDLPEDKEALKAILRSLWQERDEQRQRAEAQAKRADELYLENLQLQKELLRYKKATYGPRADRLSENELAQVLLEFAAELEQKPLPAEGLPQEEAEPEVRRVQRRKGRRLSEFRPSSSQHARLRTDWRTTTLFVLRRAAARDRQRGKLADRILSRPLRALAACAQEVCLLPLRTSRRKSPDPGSGQSRDSDREGLCRPGTTGFHCYQQICGLPPTL